MVQRMWMTGWWIGLGLWVGLAAASATGTGEWWQKPRTEQPPVTVGPEVPDKNEAVAFVLDGDGYDGDFGYFVDGDINRAAQALYLNRFTPERFPVLLDEIQIFFTCSQFDGTSDDGDCIGKSIDLVVIEDTDGDGTPQTGAQTVVVQAEVVQTIDKVNFSIYRLDAPVLLDGPGDVFVGFIPRWIERGVTGFTVPTTMENVVPHPGRSWGLAWTGDPPADVALPADDSAVTTDDVDFDSTFKIRASGQYVTDGACIPSERTLCLGPTRRFSAEVTYSTAEESGDGHAVSLSTLDLDAGGIFWFFDRSNPELLVKVLDGCDVNDRFWVFFAGTTDVGFELTITDLVGGAELTYPNSRGNRANAITDTQAFATCDVVGDPVRFGWDEDEPD